ncbi:MAG: glycine dehydrogenase (aminomethyl-transferring) [Planctomycetes bacterium RBG_16_59_8]|nr:MAG: glycine dehydrogenase (aminomethyl-transferring) [Planctomycetes bacterium RBG_16_59_8]
MDYIQNTREETTEMLKTIGVSSIPDLFRPVPENLLLKKRLDLPPAMSEPEILRHMGEIRRSVRPMGEFVSFLGGGCERHHVPSVVDHLVSRNEFATAYTPYQAEASQGNLQAIFEYQSMMCALTGLDVSNASHYDGATALADAVQMCIAQTERKAVLLSRAVHPEYRQVLQTYLRNLDIEVLEIPVKNGLTDLGAIAPETVSRAACVVLQNPNFFGAVEDIEAASATAHAHGALLTASVHPLSLAILKTPGESGVDVATGEGQSLGIDPSFGGPGFGFITATEALLRRVPGRIVGETTDVDGKRGFTLTLQTREQHIRRDRAASNICTNQALMALRAAVYLAVAGKEGLREVAEQSLQKSHYLAERLSGLPGFRLKFGAPFFHEFVLECPKPVPEINKELLRRNILGGIDLGKYYPDLAACMLLCVTELTTKEEMDIFVRELSRIAG